MCNIINSKCAKARIEFAKLIFFSIIDLRENDCANSVLALWFLELSNLMVPHTGTVKSYAQIQQRHLVTYEVGKAKAEQAAGMFGLTADQRAASCPSRVAHVRVKLINI